MEKMGRPRGQRISLCLGAQGSTLGEASNAELAGIRCMGGDDLLEAWLRKRWSRAEEMISLWHLYGVGGAGLYLLVFELGLWCWCICMFLFMVYVS